MKQWGHIMAAKVGGKQLFAVKKKLGFVKKKFHTKVVYIRMKLVQPGVNKLKN